MELCEKSTWKPGNLSIVNYAGNDKKIILRFDICISLFSYLFLIVIYSDGIPRWNLSDRDIFTGIIYLWSNFWNSVPVLVYSSSWYDLINLPYIYYVKHYFIVSLWFHEILFFCIPSKFYFCDGYAIMFMAWLGILSVTSYISYLVSQFQQICTDT